MPLPALLGFCFIAFLFVSVMDGGIQLSRKLGFVTQAESAVRTAYDLGLDERPVVAEDVAALNAVFDTSGLGGVLDDEEHVARILEYVERDGVREVVWEVTFSGSMEPTPLKRSETTPTGDEVTGLQVIVDYNPSVYFMSYCLAGCQATAL